jgi:hypothetical protein
VKTLTMMLVGAALAISTGCADSTASSAHPSDGPSSVAGTPTPSGPPRTSGDLPRRDLATALRIARHQQRKITGTFVGATAFLSKRSPFAEGSACDRHHRIFTVRLVWEADANFVHGGADLASPDGPRKALLFDVDPRSGEICDTWAKYRAVGARSVETLLYGTWPTDPTGPRRR